jgi:hypothetical protein
VVSSSPTVIRSTTSPGKSRSIRKMNNDIPISVGITSSNRRAMYRLTAVGASLLLPPRCHPSTHASRKPVLKSVYATYMFFNRVRTTWYFMSWTNGMWGNSVSRIC